MVKLDYRLSEGFDPPHFPALLYTSPDFLVYVSVNSLLFI